MDEDRVSVKLLRVCVSSLVGLLASLVLFSFATVGMMFLPFIPELVNITTMMLPTMGISLGRVQVNLIGQFSLVQLLVFAIFFLFGGVLTGFLAVTVKKAIISTTVISIVFGIVFILLMNLVYVIAIILAIILGGIIGGYVAAEEE